MKFVVSSTALLNVLQTSSKVVSNKNTLPILDNFLFDLKEGNLKITASDLETTFVGSIAVDKMDEAGLIAVPVKLMLDSLKEFSEQPLTFEADESSWEIKISWKTGELTIPGTSGLSYPALPELNAESVQTLDINTDMLLSGISKTIFATAEDELRPVMNGIYVNIADGEATFVATDAHKLVKYVSPIETEVNTSFILPKKPAILLRGVLSKEQETIRMEIDGKNVTFKLKNHTLYCRLIEGAYPNYNAVIPAGNPNHVQVDRLELLNGIKRVAVCSNQSTNLIKLDLEHDAIRLTAQDLDFSVSAQESLPCEYEGEAMSIGFKSTFLIEILTNIDSENVMLELGDSTRAGVFKPAGNDTPGTEVLMLLMPMIINA